MKLCFALLIAFTACLGQSTSSRLDEEHARGLQQNPPGVTLTVAIPDGTVYHLSDVIHFRLSFRSDRPLLYTLEIAPGGSAAAASDDFIIQGAGMTQAIHSQDGGTPRGIVCCGSYREYLAQKPVTVTESFSPKWAERRLPNPSQLLFPNWSVGALKAGDYSIFVQTRRVMRGWPKSDRERYFVLGDTVVTSGNILHITVLPESEDKDKP